uniref:Uncharacterized protein n=1 Tax=Ditylum brightwellii TaxID=49249 RepID=A0A7S2EQP8_9STRA
MLFPNGEYFRDAVDPRNYSHLSERVLGVELIHFAFRWMCTAFFVREMSMKCAIYGCGTHTLAKAIEFDSHPRLCLCCNFCIILVISCKPCSLKKPLSALTQGVGRLPYGEV